MGWILAHPGSTRRDKVRTGDKKDAFSQTSDWAMGAQRSGSTRALKGMTEATVGPPFQDNGKFQGSFCSTLQGALQVDREKARDQLRSLESQSELSEIKKSEKQGRRQQAGPRRELLYLLDRVCPLRRPQAAWLMLNPPHLDAVFLCENPAAFDYFFGSPFLLLPSWERYPWKQRCLE